MMMVTVEQRDEIEGMLDHLPDDEDEPGDAIEVHGHRDGPGQP
jgi:hypothetical protein